MECFNDLDDQLAPAGQRAWRCDHIQPSRRAVASAVRIVPHIWRTSKAGQSPFCYRRGVRVRIHLQGRSDEGIDGILAGELAEDTIGPESSIFTRKENVWASCNILIHADLAPKTMNALDPTTFNSRNEGRVRVQCPMFANLSLQAQRFAVRGQQQFDRGCVETDAMI